jgi:hypothetical protein
MIHKPLESLEMDEKVEMLATQLIQRLHEFNDHQREIGSLKVNIITPKQHERVGRRVAATGTTQSLPKTITPWLVVEAGGRYHPQPPPIATTNWHGKVTIGGKGPGTDNGVDFPIHVIATSKSANETFNEYLRQQEKKNEWHGLELPADTQILATTTVRRDDGRAS